MASKLSLQAFAESVRGASHIRRGQVLQDASIAYTDKNVGIVAVADGHGSEAYARSDRGSRFAVASACDVLSRLYHQNPHHAEKLTKQDLRQIALCIYYQWQNRVQEDNQMEPMKDYSGRITTLYGTTLLAAFITHARTYLIQIGDGSVHVVKQDGEVVCPMPEDPNCMFNRTTSLCDEQPLKYFRYSQLPTRSISSLYLCTDGLDGSYQPEVLPRFFQRCDSMLKVNSEASEQIKNYLSTISDQGSGDDVSLAAVYDISFTKP